MSVAVGSEGLLALAGHYGVENVARFLLEHVDTLKQAANGTVVHQCGVLLEQVIVGFGKGSEAGLMLIGMGQALLGNPLTVSSATVVITNPVVMTCAAIGAIHYGWKALGQRERTALLDLVAGAFGVGTQMVRAVLDFALELLRRDYSRYLPELKGKVAEGAAYFGRRLSDVTRATGDRTTEAFRHLSISVGSLTASARRQLPWSGSSGI